MGCKGRRQIWRDREVSGIQVHDVTFTHIQKKSTQFLKDCREAKLLTLWRPERARGKHSSVKDQFREMLPVT